MGIRKRDYLFAIVKNLWTLFCISLGVVLTLPLSPIIALTSKKYGVHPMGKPVEETHLDRYVSAGSSGKWEYQNSSINLFKWWNNYEDGLLGEPSGKHSARVEGKERSFFSKVRWLIRNPFNQGKRTIPLFHCLVNECDVSFKGKYFVHDKDPEMGGWNFVKAVHRKTGKSYYGFRWVKHYPDGGVRNFYFGYKLKPEHRDTWQDVDDQDKAFTIRYPFKTKLSRK